jgi:hypothetical protein
VTPGTAGMLLLVPGDPALTGYPGTAGSGAGTASGTAGQRCDPARDPNCRCDRAGDPGCPNEGALRMDPNVSSGQRDRNVWAPTPPPAVGESDPAGATRDPNVWAPTPPPSPPR